MMKIVGLIALLCCWSIAHGQQEQNQRVALETNTPHPLLRLEAANVLQSRDSMVLWLDANTRRQRRIEINSSLDAKPVRIVTEFKDLPDGPTYMARSVVDYPDEELTLTMENFGYELTASEEELLLTLRRAQ